MAGAAVMSFGVVALSVGVFPAPTVADEPGARLAFALRWQLLPLLALLYGIAWLARYRFFHAHAIHGDNPPDDRALMAGRAYLENTTEQLLLAFIAHMALAVLLPVNWLQLIPALAVWFTICRVLFRLGYAHGAPARAFGFAGTFYATIIAIVIALAFALFG
ncbi:MAG TPA: MAPEG family protein [Rhizobiaceae bacterium]|nr:MAPEG family protein [Rhizobiaceae bacterium]